MPWPSSLWLFDLHVPSWPVTGIQYLEMFLGKGEHAPPSPLHLGGNEGEREGRWLKPSLALEWEAGGTFSL